MPRSLTACHHQSRDRTASWASNQRPLLGRSSVGGSASNLLRSANLSHYCWLMTRLHLPCLHYCLSFSPGLQKRLCVRAYL